MDVKVVVKQIPCHNGLAQAGISCAISIKNSEAIADKEKLAEWLPVDVYIGGAEHAVLHLLYARFWHKFLYDIGVVPTKEPFKNCLTKE